MLSKDKYKIFQREVEPIVEDTFIQKINEENFNPDDYFFQFGLWSHTQDSLYFYDKQRLANHKNKLLSICKRLPKFHPPTNGHAGIISSFDLIPDQKTLASQSPEETIYQFNLSNHFANLVCGTEIASINPISNGKDSAFIIVLDSKYRSFMEREGQEPFED